MRHTKGKRQYGAVACAGSGGGQGAGRGAAAQRRVAVAAWEGGECAVWEGKVLQRRTVASSPGQTG